jgi:hypothetical protein
MIDVPQPQLVCHVIRVHDGDGPLWCRSGVKIRVAGVQAPDCGGGWICYLQGSIWDGFVRRR